MPEFSVLEPAIDPNNRIGFLLDWELTMKCNLDCSYCPTHLYGGHDNSVPHPPVEECLSTINFMFDYVDQYMKYKPPGLKYVTLNVYGGEALAHPDIETILKEVHLRYQHYADQWHLTVTTTTNGVVSKKVLEKIIPYIDEFTVSYHSEATDKQKQQVKDNLLLIKNNNKRIKTIVLMHSNSEKFADSQAMISWLTDNQIKHLPRQLDDISSDQWNYNPQQIKWFNDLYQSKSYNTVVNKINEDSQVNLSDTGRACCGGRQLCENQNLKQRKFYVIDNKFTGWSCSVNWFFLYVKQVTQEVFTNKDCKMNYQGTVGTIGKLSNAADIVETLKESLDNNTLPVIQCKKPTCYCGLCAPKANDTDTYHNMFKKYQKGYYK